MTKAKCDECGEKKKKRLIETVVDLDNENPEPQQKCNTCRKNE